MVKIIGAHACVDDGHYNEDDGQDGESSEFFSRCDVISFMTWLVHSHELEDEIC